MKSVNLSNKTPPGRILGLEPGDVGWIPYWNLLPLRKELFPQFTSEEFFRFAEPKLTNKDLSQGVTKVAPASSIALLKYPNLNILAPVGVFADGAVQSVYIGLNGIDSKWFCDALLLRMQLIRDIFEEFFLEPRVVSYAATQKFWRAVNDLPPLDQQLIPRIKMSSVSDTSSTLAKIFWRLLFGCSVVKEGQSTQMKAEVVIGDLALQRRPNYQKVLDLGLLWKGMTGFPFVFSVWQGREGFENREFAQLLTDLAIKAQMTMHSDPTRYLPSDLPLNSGGQEINLTGYWKNLSYKLRPKEIKSLKIFLLLASHLYEDRLEDLQKKFIQWDELMENFS